MTYEIVTYKQHNHFSSSMSTSLAFSLHHSPVSRHPQLRPSNGRLKRNPILYNSNTRVVSAASKTAETTSKSCTWKDDYAAAVREWFVRPDDSGPPRWLSPLECGARAPDSPLLLFLPGIEGTGLGLIRHYTRLGKIFDIWCLHIPFMDRTPAADIVSLVETTVKSEHCRCPRRPIYIVGESLGACFALDVAARNTDIDLVLILANPATSFSKSVMHPLLTLLEVTSPIGIPNLLASIAGHSLTMAIDNAVKGFPFQQVAEDLGIDLSAVASFLTILASTAARETLLWKLKLFESASASANSHLHNVTAQTMILSSGMDQFLPSQMEGERLRNAIPKCENRKLDYIGHFLFLKDDFDLVTIIKSSSAYRRGKYHDYITDYMPPTPSEFKKVYDSNKLIHLATNPVMLSTTNEGRVVKSLAGIPQEGPVLYVGYHMYLGLELFPLVCQLKIQRNVELRGLAHPLMFSKIREGWLPELQSYDAARLLGAVPVSGNNLYKLLSSNAHVLLYPGGVREALHRKGEEYNLFWPEHSEFVRMAATFGAKIIPFGVVGEDDISEIIFDYNDQIKYPYLKSLIQEMTNEATTPRNEQTGEVANQDIHFPIPVPKVPGRFYYYFGQPIETAERKQELRDKEKAQELYLQVKSEVETCIAFLKMKRESDPYRNLLPRLLYQAKHGLNAQIPTFEL